MAQAPWDQLTVVSAGRVVAFLLPGPSSSWRSIGRGNKALPQVPAPDLRLQYAPTGFLFVALMLRLPQPIWNHRATFRESGSTHRLLSYAVLPDQPGNHRYSRGHTSQRDSPSALYCYRERSVRRRVCRRLPLRHSPVGRELRLRTSLSGLSSSACAPPLSSFMAFALPIISDFS